MHILTLHCPVMFIRDIMQWRLRHVWDTEIKRLLQNFLPGLHHRKYCLSDYVIGIPHLAPKDVAQNSDAVKCWLKTCGASKVLIHFDMDVLDPSEIVAAVGTDPEGMKMEEVIRVINDIAVEKEIVGLTIAEPMPRTAIRIKDMLNRLPLLK